jgi:hypothetical protein
VEGQADASEPGADADRGVTPGGYAYEVVRDEEAPEPRVRRRREPGEARRFSGGVLLAAVALTAVVAVIAGWFAASLAGEGGSDDARASANVGNVISAFSRQEGATINRSDGALPASYPDGIPVHPDARLVSSVEIVNGEDVSYLVAYDVPGARGDVAAFYAQAFEEDPWQLDAVQDSTETSVHQFSRIDDPNIEGFVLSAESEDDRLTTILVSLRVIQGAPEQAAGEPFEPGESKPLPEGFPSDDVPMYGGATVIETLVQREPGAVNYSVTAVTQDSADDVIAFYRGELEPAGWSVEDAGDGGSTLAGAQAVQFASADGTTQGIVVAGELGEDPSFTRVEVQLRTTTSS